MAGRPHKRQLLIDFLREHWLALVVVLLFMTVYGLISLVNHHFYRTYALDLGLYTNAAWKYAHFMRVDRSLFLWNRDLLLADHFDLHLLLWAPLTYLFGQWTLLVVQITAVALGGIGLHRYAIEVNGDRVLATLTMCCGLAFFGVFSAFAFDFHSSVVAAMALPWYLLALRRGRLARSWWLLLFMIIAKENIGYWMGVVALAALALPLGAGVKRSQVVLQAVTAFGWSLLITNVLMPALNQSGQSEHNHYAVLGNNAGEVIENVFLHPFTVFRAFFEDVQHEHPDGTGIKMEFYFLVLVSGGWALFRGWPFLLMCLPLIAQKMLHDEPGKWGSFAHYSVELAMILPLAVLHSVHTLGSRSWRLVAASASLMFTLGATQYALDFPLEHNTADDGFHDRIRFYQERHYQRAFDPAKVERVLASIPRDAAVSALSPLVPHLIERRDLYQFPQLENATFIVLLPHDSPYPMKDWEEYAWRIGELKKDPGWKQILDDPEIVVFERN